MSWEILSLLLRLLSSSPCQNFQVCPAVTAAVVAVAVAAAVVVVAAAVVAVVTVDIAAAAVAAARTPLAAQSRLQNLGCKVRGLGSFP